MRLACGLHSYQTFHVKQWAARYDFFLIFFLFVVFIYVFIYLFICLFIYNFLFQEPTAILSRKRNGGGCARGWCVRRGSLLQDCLSVPMCKHEIFMRIDKKHSYVLLKLFHNL